jgi:acid phosphatase (class A)
MKHVIELGRPGLILFALACAAVFLGCAAHNEINKGAAPATPAAQTRPAKMPDSLTLVPPPPAAGSAAFAADEAISRKALALRDTPAWSMAILDADASFPNAAGTFSCALNAPVTEADTPRLYRLLKKSIGPAVTATRSAKTRYQRRRPFLANGAPICTPEQRKRLEHSWSYPSGHNAIGMMWALLLAEIAPERADAILARGQAYGTSRMVCNVHWYSDAVQGRFMGAYAAAVLHADPAIRDDIEAARTEFAAVRTKGLLPTRDCAAEAAAMELQKTLFK